MIETFLNIALFLGWFAVLHGIIVRLITGKPIQHAELYINPLLAAALIQGGAGLVNAIQDRPEVPDVFSPALREAGRSRARILELLQRQGANLDSSLAAVGATGSGGAGQREALIRSSTGAVADIDASVADLLTQAGNQQRQLQFNDALQTFQSRQNAVAELANAGTGIVALQQLGQTQGSAIPGPSPGVATTPQIDPLAADVAQLNTDAMAARTLPEGFLVNPLIPKVNPSTGRISFGG